MADKLYAEQEIIEEVEEAIGEKGKVIFDATTRAIGQAIRAHQAKSPGF